MHIHDRMLTEDLNSASPTLEQAANGVLNGMQRVLGSDFVDFYEQRGISPFAEVTLSKVVFMRLALDEPGYVVNGKPRFQLAIEAISHGVSAEDAETGISPEKLDPFDGVKLHLVDNAIYLTSGLFFEMYPSLDEGSVQPNFRYDRYYYRKDYSELPRLIHRAYGIGFERNIDQDAGHTKADELVIMEQVLRE